MDIHGNRLDSRINFICFLAINDNRLHYKKNGQIRQNHLGNRSCIPAIHRSVDILFIGEEKKTQKVSANI